VEAFRALSKDHETIASVNERASPGAPKIACGAYYRAMTVNVPRYLLYIQEKARSWGVQVVKTRLAADGDFSAALQEAERLAQASGRVKPSCFVNATGLGAKKLCGDEDMYPIRGQTVLVKGEASTTITRVGDGYRAYCIPRPGSGTTILGGTKEEGIWDERPDDKITEQILLHNAWQIPELLTGPDGRFEVVSVQCGLRPARKGGPRMETEVVGARTVVHAYGHAGAGYQNSVGSARAVVGMVGESLATHDLQAKL
jgi:D-amino-acid oxidase